MLAFNVNISLFRIRTAVSKSLERCHVKNFMRRGGKATIDHVSKRGSILKEMFSNKDKRKNWHFCIMSNKPQRNVFEKVHKPHRRRSVLNSLFISNITDVISTGEIAPEMSNYNIEITGVQVSPCMKLVNVFWQVPVSQYELSEDIGQLLSIAAPKIRAEMISRNVLGRVPFIFFIRDCTNARVSGFEQAMERLAKEPKSESSGTIVPDDAFVEDLLKFTDSKVKSELKSPEPVKVVETKKKEDLTIPEKPADMRSDVFGLDHKVMMEKVLALKKKAKSPPQNTAVISPESLANEDDIFSKIPGIRFKADSKEGSLNREAIFKKFHISRKMLKEKHKNIVQTDDYECYDDDEEQDDVELSSFDEDFIDDEFVDKQYLMNVLS